MPSLDARLQLHCCLAGACEVPVTADSNLAQASKGCNVLKEHQAPRQPGTVAVVSPGDGWLCNLHIECVSDMIRTTCMHVRRMLCSHDMMMGYLGLCVLVWYPFACMPRPLLPAALLHQWSWFTHLGMRTMHADSFVLACERLALLPIN
eukprot:GHRQ01026134.1.p1 GENE.GHRQ01026134.1~~GHRQ01026134.1.p1  ORF type:complete len:149 (+),score=6.38 GHRQ01026134.1:497-943(+)